MRRFVYILFLFFFFPLAIVASGVDFKAARIVRIETLKLYEGYVNAMMRLHNISYDYMLEDEFINLFDENAIIYNNIIPYYEPGSNDSVSIHEYVELYNKIKDSKLVFENFSISSIQDNDFDDCYRAYCDFMQTIKYYRADLSYPGYSFKYKMIVKVPRQKIEDSSIESLRVEKTLGEFFVLQNPDSLKLKNDYEFSKYGRLFTQDMVRSPYDFCKDEDDIFSPLSIVQNEMNNRFYSISRQNKNKVEFGIMGSPYTLGENTLFEKDGIKKYSSDISLYAKCGFQMKHNVTNYWFFNLGLQTSLHNSKYWGTNFVEYDAVDTDGDKCLRKISLDIEKEITNVLSFSLPLTFECIVPLRNKKSFVSVEFGGYVGVNAYSSTHFEVGASYRGVYDYFGGVEFDHYYDYGDFVLTHKNAEMNITELNRMNCGAILGVSYMHMCGTKKDWLWELGFMYNGGVFTTFKKNENITISSDKNVYCPIVQSTTLPKQELNLVFSLCKLF